MTKAVTIKDIHGAAVGELELDPSVFGVAVKPTVIHEAVVAQQANARHAVAHTKTRGEVRGGGKKPWRQKGTGRARHGSIRSPIWVGGGITFGPRPDRNFSHRINRKKRTLAIRMALSEKAADDGLVVLDDLKAAEFKTKFVAGALKALGLGSRKTLLVLAGRDEKTAKSAANIPTLTTRNAENLNVIDLVGHRTLLTTRAAVERIVSLYKPKSPRRHPERSEGSPRGDASLLPAGKAGRSA